MLRTYNGPMLRLAGLLLLILDACSGAYRPQAHATGWIQVDTQHLRMRTTLSRGRAAKLAARLQHIRDVLARHALHCAFQGRLDPIPVIVLSSSDFRDITQGKSAAFYR